jgi:hypothetical protein
MRYNAYGAIVLAVLFMTATRVHAYDIYCRNSGTLIHDGSETREDWYVVNSGVRRVQMPIQTKPTTGCAVNWHSLGAMYRPPEVIAAPKLGKAQIVNNYRIYYQSARNGDDHLAVRIHWFAGGNRLQSAVVHYDIHVVDHPL